MAGETASQDALGEKSDLGGKPRGAWRRWRDRIVAVALGVALLGFGLSAGPTNLEARTAKAPNFIVAAVLKPVAGPDAAAQALPKPAQPFRIAANLRRLVPPKDDQTPQQMETLMRSHPAPEVEVTVDISDQRLRLVVDGVETGYYKVSTGLGITWTPTGMFPPKWMNRYHRSSRYNNAPMPYSVFFNGNIALHGTNHIRKLGQRASKGCVRLHPSNAREIFNLIHRRGRDKVQITVQQ